MAGRAHLDPVAHGLGVALHGPGRAQVDEQIREQYDEVAWGFDARYVLGGLHLQSELVVHERAYTDRGRPLRIGAEYQPDERRYGGYLLGGYRFDWLGLMPYVIVDYFSYLNGYEVTRPPTRDVITDECNLATRQNGTIG